ncbi:MAG: NAD(P)-dependent oxidoreductase [Candidatus Dormiibacterota bacterium]
MTILLTGASGFLGRRVVELMIAEGQDVVSLGRSAPEPTAASTVRFMAVDLTDRDAVHRAAAAVGDVDGVIHLAALVPKTSSEDEAANAFACNVMGTVHLFEAFGRPGQANVFASTAEVYGLPESHAPLDEDSPVRPRSWYGASKAAAELYCTALERRGAMRMATLRFTVLYGAGDTISRAVPNFVRSAVQGDPIRIFGGEELRDYLHVDDAARAVHLAWKHRITGTFNAGSGRGIAVRDAASAILHIAGGESAVEVLPREKPAADIVLNVARFRDATGFAPSHVFPEGLEEQIAWAAAGNTRL